jgi:hypothetical protein
VPQLSASPRASSNRRKLSENGLALSCIHGQETDSDKCSRRKTTRTISRGFYLDRKALDGKQIP